MHFIVILFLSLLPSLAWLLAVRFIDRRRPEPWKFIIETFVLGIIGAFLALQFARLVLPITKLLPLASLANVLVKSFLIDGVIEELVKFVIVLIFIYPRSFFDEPLDGVVYMVTVALGLAFFENVLIAWQIGPEILGLRAITATLMHALAGGIAGYYLGLAKFKRKSEKRSSNYLMMIGLILAILFHGLYNTIVRTNFAWNLVPIAILLIIVYWSILQGIKKVNQSKYQTIPKE